MILDKRKKAYFIIAGLLGCVLLPFLISVGSAPLGARVDRFVSTSSLKTLAICVGIFLFILVLLFFCFDHYSRQLGGSTTVKRDLRREELINGLTLRYEKRLKKRMDERINFQLELTLHYTKTGVSDEYVSKFYIHNYEDRLGEHVDPLFKSFGTEIHRLLILGDPGSGKTVLLLKLAQFFLEKCAHDEHHPVPVILNLSSWRNSYESFESWLEANLIRAAGEYGTSKKYAKKLVLDDDLLLLLDGLDEIPIEHRKSCLTELDKMVFRKTSTQASWLKYPHVVICSRTADFLAVKESAPVKATVHIEPLKPDYVIKCLEELGKKGVKHAQELLFKTKQHPTISKAFRTAFAVHLALHLAEHYDFKKHKLDDLLVAYCLMQLESIKGYRVEKAGLYLHHLAYFLSRTTNVVTFELSDIQPSWLTMNSESEFSLRRREKMFRGKHAYRIMLEIFRTVLVGLATWLIMGSLMLIIPDKTMGLDVRLLMPPFLAVIGCILFGIIFALINSLFFKNEVVIREVPQFKPSEFSVGRFFWSFKKQGIRTFIAVVLLAAAGGLIGGIYNTSLYSAGGWQNGFTYSLKSGLSHLVEGFTLSVLPVYQHTIIILGIFAWSLYQALFRSSNRTTSQSNNGGTVYHILYKIINPAFSFAIRFVLLWFLQGAVIGFCYGLTQGPFWKFFLTLFQVVIGGGYVAIVLGVLIGIYNGAVDSLFTTKSSVRIYKPYRRFWLAFLFDFFRLSAPLTTVALLISFLALRGESLTALNFSWALLALASIQLFSLIVCLYKNPLINSLAVRFMLVVQQKMPLRYKRFLNRVAKTGLMERDGGQWRFRHQLIQDLFCE